MTIFESISTKDLVELLTQYFLDQDKETVAKTLSHALIDLSRLASVNDLSFSERECLFERIRFNSDSLHNFVRGERKKLTLITVNSFSNEDIGADGQ